MQYTLLLFSFFMAFGIAQFNFAANDFELEERTAYSVNINDNLMLYAIPDNSTHEYKCYQKFTNGSDMVETELSPDWEELIKTLASNFPLIFVDANKSDCCFTFKISNKVHFFAYKIDREWHCDQRREVDGYIQHQSLNSDLYCFFKDKFESRR